MSERIRMGVEEVFKDAPRTKKVQELKEELMANLEEKYQDLIRQGKGEEEAYHMVIASIGDIDEIVATIIDKDPLNIDKVDQERKKTALVVCSAVGLYILSIITFLLLDEYGGRNSDTLAISTFMLIAGAASCLLVYHFLSRPNYVKADESIVEEFKEWKQGSSKKRQLYRSIVSIMWALIVVIYFVISFTWMNWYCSWIIFIVGAVIERIIKLIFELYEIR